MHYRIAISLSLDTIEIDTTSPAQLLMSARNVIVKYSRKYKEPASKLHATIYVKWPDGGWSQLQFREKLQLARISISTTKYEAIKMFHEIESEIAAIATIKSFVASAATQGTTKVNLEVVK